MKRTFAKAKQTDAEKNYELFNQLQKDTAGFASLQQILKEWTGINLCNSSASQLKMANRLSRVLNARNFKTYQEYADFLGKAQPEHISEFVSAMTTNTTRFFREDSHFEILRNIIQRLIAAKKSNSDPEIRIWCAATSTGQEAYTIAITILETLQNEHQLQIKMLATDIDMGALEKAADGLYTESQLADLSAVVKLKYFTPANTASGKHFRIQSNVQKLIRFAPFNLHTETYPFKHPFDIVFCRNVLIYFTRPNALEIVGKLTNSLGIGGYLFVGHSEVGYVRSPLLRMEEYSVYQKVRNA